MIKRINSLSRMSKEHNLKPIARLTLKQAIALHRNPTRLVYYFRRRNPKMPPLLFEQKEPIEKE